MIIRFVGFGGQGIVLSSYIIGQSAAYDGLNAIQNQSYGSESRGGECRGDVIISDGNIYDLEPTRYDVLIAMTQPGYEKFVGSLKPEGTLIFDKDLVVPDAELTPPGVRTFGVSATEIAFKKLGRKIVANMVMLGFMQSLLHPVSTEALEKAITLSVPKGTADLNLQALWEGVSLGAAEDATA